MNDLDDLSTRLRSQMRSATAHDVAAPDLHERVHRSEARRRRRNAGALAGLAVAAGLAFAALPTPGPAPGPERLAGPGATPEQSSPQTPPAQGLSVVRSGGSGRLAVQVSTTGEGLRTEEVELPGYVRNSAAEPVTVLAMNVPGTGLRADFPEQLELAPGGSLPLSLTRVVDCAADPTLPTQLDLRLSVVTTAGSTTVLLPLPEEVVTLYRNGHACTDERRVADDAEARAAEEARRQAEEAGQASTGG